jgi:hypothetical protein
MYLASLVAMRAEHRSGHHSIRTGDLLAHDMADDIDFHRHTCCERSVSTDIGSQVKEDDTGR